MSSSTPSPGNQLGGWKGAVQKRKGFLINASMALAAFIAVVSPTVERYTFAIDSSDIRCIEDYNVFIVDYFNTRLERGGIYAFRAEGLEPFFADGQLLAKYLMGMPGDTVEVTADQRILINDVEVADTLQAAHRLDMTADEFVGKGIIGEGEYWFMGDTPESFDSRYWGSVARHQIAGRAHGIF